MACPFDITVATNSVRLNTKRQGEAAFTVFNRSGRPVRGRAQVAAQQPEAAGWLAVIGEAERNYAIAGAEQVTVQLTVPASAPPGSYAFRLDMVGVDNPDEDFCMGPSVTFEVPVAEPAKPFPWWIVAVAALVLVIGAAAFIFWPRDVTVPALRGLAVSEARATLVALGLQEGSISETDGGAIDPQRVVASSPAEGTPAPRNSAVDLVIAAAHTPTPVPTATFTPTPEPTMDAIATAQAEATAAAQATTAAIVQAINKYVGSWEVTEQGSPYITKLQVKGVERNISLEVVGLAYPALLSGGVGSVVCQSECTWGSASLPYSGDPVQFLVNPRSGVTHRITLTAVDPSNLSAVYQFESGGTTFPSTSFLFKRARLTLLDGVLAPRAAGVPAENFVPYVALTPIPVETLVAPNLDLRINPRIIIGGN